MDDHIDMTKNIALITGASRGLGLALAKALHKEGYSIYGTSRNPSEHAHLEFITFLELDLKDLASIDRLAESLPDVDVLVNNAGYSQIGSVEEIPIENLKNIFDINLLHQIYLTQKFIPGMRMRKKGIIVNITSMAGTVPVPFSTIYASVKGGFDAFSKGLRNELSAYGIKVIAVAPFQMHTTIPQSKDYIESSPYTDNIKKAKRFRDLVLDQAEEPEYIARQVIGIIRKNNPAPHNPVGKGARRKTWLIWLLPQKMVERIVRRRFGLDY